MATIQQLAAAMKERQAIKADLEEKLKAVNAEIDDLRLKQIPDLMAEQEIRSITIEDIGRVQLASDMYVSIIDKEAGYEWLRENGLDGLIQPYIQPSTLKAAVKEAVAKGVEFPEALFKIDPFIRASIVKA